MTTPRTPDQAWSGGPGRWGPDVGRRGPNPLAQLGLLLGVLGCAASVTVVGGLALGALALGFGLTGRARFRAGRAGQGRVALAGVLLGLVALVASVAMLVAVLTGPSFHHYQACRRAARTAGQLTACSHLLHYL
jgi:hypothetical protein